MTFTDDPLLERDFLRISAVSVDFGFVVIQVSTGRVSTSV